MIGTKNAAFFISMCDDVLVEVLSSGNRKQLVILTKNGKRFSRLVDCFFVRAPFLRMNVIWKDLWFILHTYSRIIHVWIRTLVRRKKRRNYSLERHANPGSRMLLRVKSDPCV